MLPQIAQALASVVPSLLSARDLQCLGGGGGQHGIRRRGGKATTPNGRARLGGVTPSSMPRANRRVRLNSLEKPNSLGQLPEHGKVTKWRITHVLDKPAE